MGLKTKFFMECAKCGKEQELDRVYGDYYSFQLCTPNNPPGRTCFNDGLMSKEYNLCRECGEKVLCFVRSDEKGTV